MNKVVTTLMLLQILHSRILSVGHHGDICHDQSDCSNSGDPNLHCTLTNDETRCLCRTHFHLAAEEDSGKIMCTINNESSIKLNKMKPMIKETRLLVENEPRQKASVLALIIVIMVALIVIFFCCCFLRLDARAPHTNEADGQVQEVKGAVHQLDEFDDIELNVVEASRIGVDNLGYNGEDCVSRYPATTIGILGEVNQRNKIRTNPHVKERNSKKEEEGKEAVKIDANGNEKESNDSSAVSSSDVPTSEVPQDDDPDIKKKMSYESQLSTESTLEISQQIRRIERVRTDDETSIDTTIPPEELILDPSKVLDLVP